MQLLQPYIPEFQPLKKFKVRVVVFNDQNRLENEYIIAADDIDCARASLETKLQISVQRGYTFTIGRFVEI